MRILHLDAGKEMRGGQWQVLRLVEGLAVQGVESTLLAREDAPLFTEARKLGWRVMPLGVTSALRCLRTHDGSCRPEVTRCPRADSSAARAPAHCAPA